MAVLDCPGIVVKVTDDAPKRGRGAPTKYRPTAIYALIGSECEIRYIGKTINLERRIKQHLASAMDGTTNKDRWVSKETKAGSLRMAVLEWTDNWRERERHWIARGRSEGWRLFNIDDGGDRAAHLCTPKARDKLLASKYRKIMATLSQIELEAKNSQDDKTAQVFRAIIDRLKTTARTIKKTAGKDKFQQWAEEIYSQCPFPENDGSLAR